MLKRFLPRQRTAASVLPFCLFVLFAFPHLLSAQGAENCTNGRDDDGDGLIDCFDPDCGCTGPCESFYYRPCKEDCVFLPPCNNISLAIDWQSEAEVGTYSPLVAGDMDRDGFPEVVTYKVNTADIYIIDGRNGRTKRQIVAPVPIADGTAPAIADLDGDGFGELLIVCSDRRVRCYNYDGTPKYQSPRIGYGQQRFQYGIINIADFDHNGRAEFSVGSQVFNGQTGALLAEGDVNMSVGDHPARRAAIHNQSFAQSVAIDALPDAACADCQGLEIVAGNQVLSVNLANGRVRVATQANNNFTDGYTSVADFDLDGDLDAIVQGRRGGQNGVNTIYVWEMETNVILRQFALPVVQSSADGASRANVADLDGNGQLDVCFVGSDHLYALKNDFTVLWRTGVIDPSQITSSSIFDFCGDGSPDVVYRSEQKLQILEGATGDIKWEDDCRSLTHIENPLILDVDADGETEVLIQCGINGSPTEGRVVAYESVGSPGIASRKVWNQHSYFSTNINDNLTVPQFQQNPHLVGDKLKLNTFLNQYFNPTFPAPDGQLSWRRTACVGDSLRIEMRVCNLGDDTLEARTPLAAYRGNPQKTPAASFLISRALGFNLAPDSCRIFSMTIPRSVNDSVFVVLNDDGTLNQTKTFPVTSLGECQYVNNPTKLLFAYAPAKIELGRDTLVCAGVNFRLRADGKDLTGWRWQDGSADSVFTVTAPGKYRVVTTDICGVTQTDSLAVRIDSSAVVRLGADRSLCQGDSISFSATGFDNYRWISDLGLNCTTCPAVSARPTRSGYAVLEASKAKGCTTRDSVFVTVNPAYRRTVDTTVCFGRKVRFNNTDIAPDSSRIFRFKTRTGCDSTIEVRVKGTTVGTFQMRVDTAVCRGQTLAYNGFNLQPGATRLFNLTSSTGCDSTVQVNVSAKDTFATAEARTVCFGESVPVFGQNQSISGKYTRRFTARNGCDSTHTFDLTVLPPILIEIDATPTCPEAQDGTLTVKTAGGKPPYTYRWSNPPTAVDSVLKNQAAGNYRVSVTDANNCSETQDAQIRTHPPIQFTAEADSVRCFGEKNGQILIRTPDPALTFSVNGGPFRQTKELTNLAAGDFTLLAQNTFGCQDTLMLTVGQPPQLLVRLPADTSLRLGDSLRLDVSSTAVRQLRYIWTGSDSTALSCKDCPAPVARPLKSSIYRLTATDAQGCSASTQIMLEVRRIIDVFVPNAISPQSENDANSRLLPFFGPAVRQVLSFQIYDRWGALCHQIGSRGLPNDVSLAWDGRRNQRVVPGVYVWTLEVELVDGSTERYSGDVTVIE